jgi:hypothetical protein
LASSMSEWKPWDFELIEPFGFKMLCCTLNMLSGSSRSIRWTPLSSMVTSVLDDGPLGHKARHYFLSMP